MPDIPYDAFIEDCLQERASLIGLIEAMESKALAPGMPLVNPDGMNGTVASTLAAFKQTVAQLSGGAMPRTAAPAGLNFPFPARAARGQPLRMV